MSIDGIRLRAVGSALVLAVLTACGGGGGGGVDGTAPAGTKPLGTVTMTTPDGQIAAESGVSLAVGSGGVVVRVEWDFGDGKTETTTQTSTTHWFEGKGEFTVKATVTGLSGETAVVTRKVNVLSADPKLSIATTDTVGVPVATRSIQYFSADIETLDYKPKDSYRYRWDFGDGSTSEEASVSHVYATSGRYTVKLTLSDPNGRQFSASREVEVSPITPYPMLATMGGSGLRDGGPNGLVQRSASITRRPDGTLLLAGEGVVRVKEPDRGLRTLAGTKGWGGSPLMRDGVGSEARLGSYLWASALDAQGVLHLIDGSALRSVAPDGTVKTFAWSGTVAVDGTAGIARIQSPLGLAAIGDDVYLADGSTVRRLRAGRLETFIGKATEAASRDGAQADARFAGISALASDDRGRLLILEECQRVRRIDRDGNLSTIATLPPLYSTPGCGYERAMMSGGRNGGLHVVRGSQWTELAEDGAIQATRWLPESPVSTQFAVDGDDLVYTARDVVLGRARPDGVWNEILGIDTRGTRMFPPQMSPTSFSQLSTPAAMQDGSFAVAADGRLQRLVWPGQRMEPLARSGWGLVDGPELQASTWSVKLVAVGAQDQVVFVDGETVRRRDADGRITTVAGDIQQQGDADGAYGASRFTGIQAVAVDRSGSAWVLDQTRLARVTPDGQTTTVLRGRMLELGGLSIGKDGLPLVRKSGAIYCVALDGTTTLVTGKPDNQGGGPDWERFSNTGFAVHPDGTLYLLDSNLSSGHLVLRRMGVDGRIQVLAEIRNLLYPANLFQDPYEFDLRYLPLLSFTADGRPVVSSAYRVSFWLLEGVPP